MAFSLAPPAQQEGYRLEVHESVRSTNAVALERARQGDDGFLWVVTRRQPGGRGRRGRSWAMAEGNLAASLLVVDRCDLRLAATLGFVAGLAIAEALDAVMPADCGAGLFELKWPNDVLARGAKLVGILLESTMIDERKFGLAIGIGVNVVAGPENLAYPTTCLSTLGGKADAQSLFLALSDSWRENFNLWNAGRGLDAIRRRWLSRAAGLGGKVAVDVDGKIIRGIFETIDEDCRFVIRNIKGEAVTIAAGDVHFGSVASAGAA